MNINKVKQSLKLHEGVRNLPYEDSVGVLTIGCGHNLEVPLTMRAIETILEDDIHLHMEELDRVLPQWRTHSDNVQDTLLEMCFNLGAPRLLTFKKMLKALDNRHYLTASTEMLDSKWAGQVGKRAETLAAAMANG